MAAVVIALIFLFFPPIVASKADVISHPPVVHQTPRTIHYYSWLFGADEPVALAIAKCESQFVAGARNPSSSAKGVYQFLDGTWSRYALLHWGTVQGKDVLNYGDNVELGTWVIANYGTADWLASAACWDL